MSLNTVTQSVSTDQVDVRGPRFSAWVTSVILLSALIVSAFSTSAAAVILAAQAAAFARDGHGHLQGLRPGRAPWPGRTAIERRSLPQHLPGLQVAATPRALIDRCRAR
jgi:hypothetical protein